MWKLRRLKGGGWGNEGGFVTLAFFFEGELGAVLRLGLIFACVLEREIGVDLLFGLLPLRSRS
jgi:hypothetical protein